MFFTFSLANQYALLLFAIITLALQPLACDGHTDDDISSTLLLQTFLETQSAVDAGGVIPRSLLQLNVARTKDSSLVSANSALAINSLKSMLRLKAASNTEVALCVGITLLVIILCLNGVLWCADPISSVVRYGIDEYGPDLIGVDLDVKYSSVSVLRGIVDIRDLIVKNPIGYQTPYLLRAGRILVDLDSSKLYGSCCNLDHVTVSQIQLQDIDIMLETKAKGLWGTSNVQEVVDFMETKEKRELEQLESEPSPNLTLYKLDVKNVNVHLRYDQLLGVTQSVAIADMHYQDFSKRVGSYAVDEIIKLIMQSILKSTLGAATKNLKTCC